MRKRGFRATCPECEKKNPPYNWFYCAFCDAQLVDDPPPRVVKAPPYRDGGRFVVRELEGWAITDKPYQNESVLPGLSVCVLDTAYNYRLMGDYHTEDVNGGGRRERVRQVARDHAALLNEQYGAVA
jgi:hypothetical protein